MLSGRPILILTVSIVHLYLPADLAEVVCEGPNSLNRGVDGWRFGNRMRLGLYPAELECLKGEQVIS